MLAAALCTVFILAVGVRYAEHLKDNDVWFHMAYGKYLLEHRTLVPDHTVHSWTPSDNRTIYCAWIPEIVLHLLYEAGGMYALFALRYGAIAVFVLLAFLAVRKGAPPGAPLFWLVLTCGVLMADKGISRSKPELFSFLLLSVMAWAWFSFRLKPRERTGVLLLFPVLMLLWANSHGAFIFGLAFLGLVLAGEVLNLLIPSADRLDGRTLKLLAGSCAASGAAVLLTPYGWAYPAQLLRDLVLDSGEFTEHMRSVLEYQSILSPDMLSLHYVDYAVAALAVLGTLLYQSLKRGRGVDAGLLLVNVFFLVLYVKFNRATYLWAVVFVFSSLHLAAARPRQEGQPPRPGIAALNAAMVLVVLVFSARAAYDAVSSPAFGFRLNYKSPAAEARFIGANYPGLRMGNDYDCGAYLLWSLWPGHRVFIDTRYFPYRSWYPAYMDFAYGKDRQAKDRFLETYRAEVWCLTYDFGQVEYFLNAPGWRLAYYGPSACVFADRKTSSGRGGHGVSSEIFRVGNIYQGAKIVYFALAVGDLGVARQMLDRLRPIPFNRSHRAIATDACVAVGNAFASRGDVRGAVETFEAGLRRDPHSPGLNLALGKALAGSGRLLDAIWRFEAAVREKPDSTEAVLALQKASQARDSLQALEARAEKAIASDAANPDLHAALADIQARLGRQREALTNYRKALSLRPDHVPSLYGLARIHSVHRDYAKALEALQSVARLRPLDPDAFYDIACILSRQGRTDQAVEYLRKAVDRGFSRWDLLRTDPDLATVRDTPYVAGLLKDRTSP
jgi:tetratricopeptide (TPR) repeat protein